MKDAFITTVYDEYLKKIEYNFQFLKKEIESFFNIGDIKKRSREIERVLGRYIFFMFSNHQHPQKRIGDFFEMNRSVFGSLNQRYEYFEKFKKSYKNFLDYYFFNFEKDIFFKVNFENKVKSEKKLKDDLKFYKQRLVKKSEFKDAVEYRVLKLFKNWGVDINWFEAKEFVKELIYFFGFHNYGSYDVHSRLKKLEKLEKLKKYFD